MGSSRQQQRGLTTMSRGGETVAAKSNKQHPSAIDAAFSVEAYSTLEAESRAHLAAVAAASASSTRRRYDDGDEEDHGEEEAAEVRARAREK